MDSEKTLVAVVGFCSAIAVFESRPQWEEHNASDVRGAKEGFDPASTLSCTWTTSSAAKANARILTKFMLYCTVLKKIPGSSPHLIFFWDKKRIHQVDANSSEVGESACHGMRFFLIIADGETTHTGVVTAQTAPRIQQLG